MKWEYMNRYLQWMQFTPILQEMGEEEWELVNFVDSGTHIRAVFKRPKK